MSSILVQVRDIAAKCCGEPHVVPSWDIAKRSLGAMLAKNPDLAERAASIRLDAVCDWDPENGLLDYDEVDTHIYDGATGQECLEEFRAACAAEEAAGESPVEVNDGE